MQGYMILEVIKMNKIIKYTCMFSNNLLNLGKNKEEKKTSTKKRKIKIYIQFTKLIKNEKVN